MKSVLCGFVVANKTCLRRLTLNLCNELLLHVMVSVVSRILLNGRVCLSGVSQHAIVIIGASFNGQLGSRPPII